MKDCAVEAKVTSFLPTFARNAHGNLAEQNRTVGAQHGVDTRPAQPQAKTEKTAVVATAAGTGEAAADSTAVQALTQKNNCTACHAIDQQVVGPSWSDIAKKHEGKADYIAGKIRSGGTGIWGAIPDAAADLERCGSEDDRDLAGRGRAALSQKVCARDIPHAPDTVHILACT